MFLRQLRWIAAGVAIVAAVCASPAQSKADIQILVEELDGSNVPFAATRQFTTSAGSGATSFNGTYFTGLVTVSSNSSTPGASVASLTPSFSGQLTSAFNVAQDYKLRITVTDDGFTPNGPNGTLRVQTSGSTGFASGTESVASETRIYNPNAGSQVPATSTTQLANGATVAGPVSLFTPNGTLVTNGAGLPVAGLSSPYAIQQTIIVSFSGNIPANATFGATGGASVTSDTPPAAVPAPGGLALALIALPLLGLRRTLRKRAAA